MQVIQVGERLIGLGPGGQLPVRLRLPGRVRIPYRGQTKGKADQLPVMLTGWQQVLVRLRPLAEHHQAPSPTRT